MQAAAEQEAFILAHNLEVTVNESMGKIGYFDLKSRFVYVCMYVCMDVIPFLCSFVLVK